MTGPQVDPLADYSPDWRQTGQDPLAGYHPGWKGGTPPDPTGIHAKFKSGQLQKEQDAAIARDEAAAAPSLGEKAAGAIMSLGGAKGSALEALQAHARALVRGIPYPQALQEIQDAKDAAGITCKLAGWTNEG